MQDEEADRLSEGTREFAQAILGRQVSSRDPKIVAQKKLAQLEWLATFSPRHEEELRRLRRGEAQAREKQEHLAWLASISAVSEAAWDPAKHPRGGFSQNRGWFSTKSGAGDGSGDAGASYSFGGRKKPSITDTVVQRNRAMAELTGTVTPDMVRTSRAAIDIKSALELPQEVSVAAASGARTGVKAVVNGSATAVKNVATLGLSSSQLELIGVTKEDRENGYDTAVSIATASGEVLIAVGTAGMASALAKGGTIAQNTGGALVAYDAAGNAVGVVQGTYDAAKNGVNVRNGVAVAAGALGLGGNVAGAKALISPPTGQPSAIPVRGGPYGHLEDAQTVNSGKDFTRAQKRRILEENKNANGNTLRDDRTGEALVPPQKRQRGVPAPPNEAQVDHVYPKSKGGPNSYSNAEVRSRINNARKGDKID